MMMIAPSQHRYDRLSPIPEDGWIIDDDVSTFHLLLNQERKLRGLPSLHRSLDALAAQHARSMAEAGTVFHSAVTLDELKERVAAQYAGENVQRGHSAILMHDTAMMHPINRSNILSALFSEFGVGVATGRDGQMYVCQLFRGGAPS